MGVQARELRWGVVGMMREEGGRRLQLRKTKPSLRFPQLQQQALDKAHLGTWLHPVRSSSFSRPRLFSNYDGASFPVTPRDPFYLSCWTTPKFLFFSRHGAATVNHHPIALASKSRPFAHRREPPTKAPNQPALVTPTTNPFKFLPVTATGCLTWPSSPMTAESIGRSISLTTAHENPNRLEQALAERQSSRCKNT